MPRDRRSRNTNAHIGPRPRCTDTPWGRSVLSITQSMSTLSPDIRQSHDYRSRSVPEGPRTMRKLIVLGVVGLIAQLIDGSLGMAYGVTSSTLLLAAGVAPAAASAAVHFSEIGTSLVSGASHHKLGNVDWRTVSILALPGFVGAFLGATLLSNMDAAVAKPVVAIILLSLGFYVVYRFLRLGGERPTFKGHPSAMFLAPMGLVAGTLDAVGGGGWGPVGTTSLLSSGRLEPRKVVGSIDTSEFVVAVGASLGFLFGLGSAGINWGYA